MATVRSYSGRMGCQFHLDNGNTDLTHQSLPSPNRTYVPLMITHKDATRKRQLHKQDSFPLRQVPEYNT